MLSKGPLHKRWAFKNIGFFNFSVNAAFWMQCLAVTALFEYGTQLLIFAQWRVYRPLKLWFFSCCLVFVSSFLQIKWYKWSYCDKSRTYFTSNREGCFVLASIIVYYWYKIVYNIVSCRKILWILWILWIFTNINNSHANAKFGICALSPSSEKCYEILNFAHAWYFKVYITKLISLFGFKMIRYPIARLKK